MKPTPSSGAGSGNSAYTLEAAETLRFEEEIQSLMRDNLIQHGLESPPPAGCGSSFTALLGLPPSQAVELLHEPEAGDPRAGAASCGGDMWRHKALRVPLGCSPTFPSNATLVERAARFSVFAAEDSAPSNSGDRSPPKPKAEPADYGDLPICPIRGEGPQRPGKRRDGERAKVKGGTAKKSRSAGDDTGGESLPYIHVRARRGQATDSHSLAERARREKINARMKLLQELVPGCSKITGTALVLDEIINHVQSLQRQVEFLSMRLAAANPRIDFSGIDSFLSAESGRVTVGNGRSGMGLEQPLLWSEGSPAASNGGRRQQLQVWHVDAVQQQEQQGPSVCWDDTTRHAFLNSAASLFGYDSSSSVSHSNQLRTEL